MSGRPVSAVVAKTPRRGRSPFVEDDESVAEQFSPRNDPGSGGNAEVFGITVAVRIRPFSQREKDGEKDGKGPRVLRPDEPVVDVEADGKTLMLLDPMSTGSSHLTFVFDHIISPLAPSVDLDVPDTGNRRETVQDWQDGASQRPARDTGDSLKPRCARDVGRHAAGRRFSCGTTEAEKEQQQVFELLAVPVVGWSLRGFNACVFAYGQTGSGKTYTMMGTPKYEGLIPRLCRLLFARIAAMEEADEQQQPPLPNGRASPTRSPPGLSGGSKSDGESRRCTPSPDASMSSLAYPARARLVKVTISFMEIYNEQVRDLLKPDRGKNTLSHYNSRFDSDPIDAYETLRVRQHPLHGRFVEGLTNVEVDSWGECLEYIHQGNAVRAQTSTRHNETSSRSHAIFQLIVTQTAFLGGRVRGREVTSHLVSKVNLVDLAGSERLKRDGGSGRLQSEANAINLSLSVLRRVITALLKREKLVPYRESLLTYVLADNFGGNSRTIMCATISPHFSKYAETESTLRYAALARGVMNRVKVNEQPHAKIIRELKERMKQLQEELHGPHSQGRASSLEEMMQRKARALEELRQREEELQGLLRAAHQREEELLEKLNQNQAAKAKWKQRAQRRKQKRDQLVTTLKALARQQPDRVAESVRKLSSEDSETESEDTPSPVAPARASKSHECLPEIPSAAAAQKEAFPTSTSARQRPRVEEKHTAMGLPVSESSSPLSCCGRHGKGDEGRSTGGVRSQARGGNDKDYRPVGKMATHEENAPRRLTPRPPATLSPLRPAGAHRPGIVLPLSLMNNDNLTEGVNNPLGYEVAEAGKRSTAPLRLAPLQESRRSEAPGAVWDHAEMGTPGRPVSRSLGLEGGPQRKACANYNSSGELIRRLSASRPPPLQMSQLVTPVCSQPRSILRRRDSGAGSFFSGKDN
ncbi:putative kinesin [Trypanosoma conorhini]|uniref:Kinesin-like protein n=1 Tax=Trypanosoma conorhini TaxID=83891 RepID=A0A3S5IUG4_9TRYP|nr:putative kinesin [Trypanosoma conorhini]RNF25674.1 putative kinesin [Trypanosoma conorhini]